VFLQLNEIEGQWKDRPGTDMLLFLRGRNEFSREIAVIFVPTKKIHQ
jgi:hypothetical protein